MYTARERVDISHWCADAMLGGDWDSPSMRALCHAALRPRPRWVADLVAAVLTAYPRPPLDRPRELAGFIAVWLEQYESGTVDSELHPDLEPAPRLKEWKPPRAAMGRRRWPTPEILSVSALADALGLSDGDLQWFADVHGLERKAPEQLRNYRYVQLKRPGRVVRVIEQPKPRLKAVQRRILRTVLSEVPVSEDAHGFVPGRSVLTHANTHSRQRLLLSMDLQSFFTSVTATRVFGIFQMMGYPEQVAYLLAGLTTNVVPNEMWANSPTPGTHELREATELHRRRLAVPHLPQGAPTSPTLANLAAFTLDRRLHGLADRFEANYSRYADDLTFSGPQSLLAAAPRLRSKVAEIVAAEGFTVNPQKTRFATNAGSQRTCGLVVNATANVPREQYDLLRATLNNCVRSGPESQNRANVPDFRQHLLGRVSWVAAGNPSRGRRLRTIFEQIDWTQAG